MTKRNPYLLAAMASAVAPNLSVVAVHDSQNLAETGLRKSIETSVALDSQGEEYDIAEARNAAAGKILRKRALAAKLLEREPQVNSLNVRFEKAVATGDVEGKPVAITRHLQGTALPFSEMDPSECASVGTAIATIHLLNKDFLIDAGYPRFSADQIRTDLSQWISKLSGSKEVPESIVERWKQLVGVDALWEFKPVVVHGNYSPNDILFREGSVHAIRNWENIQVSDPASDFAWVYEDWLSDQQRDAVLSAYGRMMGSNMDARIVPRARLWRQMDTVRSLLLALDVADREWIEQARAKVEHLAGLLNPVTTVGTKSETQPHPAAESTTITVGNLLSPSSDSEPGAQATPSDKPKNTAESENSQKPSATPQNPDDSEKPDPLTNGEVIDPELEALRSAKTVVFDKPKANEAGEQRLEGTLNPPAAPARKNQRKEGEPEDAPAPEAMESTHDSDELRSKKGYVRLDDDSDESDKSEDHTSESDNTDNKTQASSENADGTSE